MLAKKVLDWKDAELNKIDENTKHGYLKAFGLGAVEGAIDSAIVWYPILLAGCYYWRKKATGK